MKFWGLESGHVCLCAKDMDDRDILVVGAIPEDRDEGRIISINWENKTLMRKGNPEPIPFPEKYYTEGDISKMHWEVHRIGTHFARGHESHDS